jgi:hypothetical protein
LSSRRCSTGSALSIDTISESFCVPDVVHEAVKQEEGDLIYSPAEKECECWEDACKNKDACFSASIWLFSNHVKIYDRPKYS